MVLWKLRGLLPDQVVIGWARVIVDFGPSGTSHSFRQLEWEVAKKAAEDVEACDRMRGLAVAMLLAIYGLLGILLLRR